MKNEIKNKNIILKKHLHKNNKNTNNIRNPNKMEESTDNINNEHKSDSKNKNKNQNKMYEKYRINYYQTKDNDNCKLLISGKKREPINNNISNNDINKQNE